MLVVLQCPSHCLLCHHFQSTAKHSLFALLLGNLHATAKHFNKVGIDLGEKSLPFQEIPFNNLESSVRFFNFTRNHGKYIFI
jgi:hypothetical protein